MEYNRIVPDRFMVKLMDRKRSDWKLRKLTEICYSVPSIFFTQNSDTSYLICTLACIIIDFIGYDIPNKFDNRSILQTIQLKVSWITWFFFLVWFLDAMCKQRCQNYTQKHVKKFLNTEVWIVTDNESEL